VKQLLGWTQKQTAACFDLDSNTIARWESESKHHPEKETVGSLLKPQPPVLRFADVVRHLVQTMAASGFGGSERIAQTLAKKPVPPPEASTERKPMVAVKARGPNHVVMADVTDVPSLFRLFTFKLAVVFDVFSRFPLAARVFPQEPSGAQLADLFREGVKKRESPRHFVSDRGPQFTSEDFRDVIHEHSISHRFGAIGKVGSIALIERLW
jgi:transposase InsO family protein